MDLIKIKQKQLIQVFKDLKHHQDEGMCFLLGAGTSVTSGIPSGGELARRWYEDLKQNLGDGLSAWQQKIEGFDEKRIAEFYPQIFEQRFKDHPSTGFYQLQDCMRDAEPNIGYSFLAQILANTQHKFVITTNFDHMIEDAIRIYTRARPLVCGHESLAPYIKAHSIRPTVIKVHRDLLLDPFNKTDNTSNLDEAWKQTLEPLLQRYYLVVIGYGGNDGSLMNYLQTIQGRKGIYWCFRNIGEINDKIRNTLKYDHDRLVEISGFDEFMLALNEAFNYPMLVNKENLIESELVQIALAKANRYMEQLIKFAEGQAGESKTTKENNDITRHALLKLFDLDEKQATSWWQIQLKIDQETDHERKQQLYEDALRLLPDSSELNCNYAVFLHNIREDYDQAEPCFRKALELAPENANNNRNYALFLHKIRKDYDQAELYYRKAVEFDPENAEFSGSYALFLHDIRKDYDQAEFYYRKTVELDPENVSSNGNYAVFLDDIRKDYDQAEFYYRKALELDPEHVNSNGNYAMFLKSIRKDYDQAEFYYRKALELDPERVNSNGSYAAFLHKLRKDYDQAEFYYRKALELNPEDVDSNGNYAGLLLSQGKQDQALPYLEKALKGKKPDTLIESWFYRLAHFPKCREEAKLQIETLLQQGVRSPGWDFTDNIRRAEQDGYPHMKELKQFAQRISEAS
jgi:Tfp pilus assembly protein PilF